MTKKILLLNDGKRPLLGIGFALRHAKYSPVLFHDPEELVNWAKLYRTALCDCLLLNGCSDAALLERLRRLLSACNLELRILVVGGDLPEEVLAVVGNHSSVSCCTQEGLIEELKRLRRSEQSSREKP